MKRALTIITGLCVLIAISCSKPGPQLIKAYPVDSLDWLISTNGVELDKNVSSDGHGSLRITATEPTTVRLYETPNLNIENARVLYQAKLKSKDLGGKAYLEMWVHINGKGEFFSRGLDHTITGNTDWVSEEIPFFINKSLQCDSVKLDLVIDGKGTVWVDDIKLYKAPLK
jgi:hypothetical protein